eukprot:481144_1
MAVTVCEIALSFTICCMILEVVTTQDFVQFVSRNGRDNNECGNQTNPCGTLYTASIHIKQSTFENCIINLIDGQNETEIINYNTLNNTNGFNPCLPIPFSSNKSIIITFNQTKITEFNQWFPKTICDFVNDNKTYLNKYMFDGGHYLTINNLIIQNYTLKNNLNGFITSSNWFNATIKCDNCLFINIISLNAHPIFYSMSSIVLSRNILLNLHTIGDIIYCDHSANIDHAIRQFVIQTTSFVNVSANSFLNVSWSYNDQHGTFLEINNCTFGNVSTTTSIINDETRQATVLISDAVIDIIHGSIYDSKHVLTSNIYITNVSVTSNQLYKMNKFNKNSLFNFCYNDIINISLMTVLYSFNVNKSCQYSTTYINSVINGSCSVMLCQNPVALISNLGHIQMDDIFIDMAIFNMFPDSVNQFVRYRYERDLNGDMSFIQNKGFANITNMMIKQSISDILLYNSGSLTLNKLTFSYNMIKYNPNALHSKRIIYQFGIEPFLSIRKSYFFGSYFQVWLSAGTAIIYDSLFQKATIAIISVNMNEMVIDHNIFINNGQHHGPFIDDLLNNLYWTQGILISESNNVVLTGNRISGYDPKGLVLVHDSSNISLINNTFNIDSTHLFYNISVSNIAFMHPWSPLTIQGSSETKIIANEFIENIFNETHIPWILYKYNYELNCMSANTFTNYAFHSINTNLTSCNKPELIECIQGCKNEMYGYIDLSLFNQIGIFNIDTRADVYALFSAYNSNVAMDNINIIAMNNNNNNNNNNNSNAIRILFDHASLLMMDSNISNNFDISYTSDNCDIIYNDRLNNTNWISRILMNCSPQNINESSDTFTKIMDSENTQIVQHFSVTKIELSVTTTTDTYYPGQLLQFEYNITDTLDHIIPFNISDPIVIHIESDTFSTQFNIENGKCSVCESGLLINVLSLKQNISNIYNMNISVANNMLIVDKSTISLNVIGCPVKYGPDNNNFTCILCNTDYYNLKHNNTNHCKSCNPNDNKMIKCIEGNISISHNYWLGFDDNNNMISSHCPTNYCCQDENGCNYINDINIKDKICASNRNYSSKLCGSCLKGYSQSIQSASCVKCSKIIQFEYIFYMLAISFLWTIFLIIVTSDSDENNNNKKTGIRRYLSNPHFMLMMKTLWNRNIMYYEQALSLILTSVSSSSLTILFHFIAQIFNFSTTTNTGKDICFIDGLNAKQKILVQLFIPSFIVMYMVGFHLISKCICNKYVIVCTCKKLKVNFAKMYVAAFLLIIGNIVAVLLKLMNCQHVGAFSVHWYFGDERCYGKTWIFSFICLISIITIFSFVFIRLRKTTVKDRQNKEHMLNTVVSKYKPKFYYWEYILFWRRTVIALFSVSVNDNTSKYIFALVVGMFMLIQKKYQPFLVDSANEMEFLLLFSLILIIFLHSLSSINTTFNIFITALFILLPFVLLPYYIYLFIIKKRDGLEYSSDKAKNKIEMISKKQLRHHKHYTCQHLDISMDYHLMDDSDVGNLSL